MSVVELSGFDPRKNTVRIDLAPLYTGLDVDHTVDFVSDLTPGCMAFAGDPECAKMMAALALGFEGQSSLG